MTPVTAELAPDAGRFVAHARWLLDEGCHGLVIFGTTGEANSFSVEERIDAARGRARRRPAAEPDPGRHRLLRAHRQRAADPPRAGAGRGGRADAAAVLLQGQSRRGAVRELRSGHPALGSAGVRPLPLPFPAALRRADHARPDRAPARPLSGHAQGRQGQLGRLEQHADADRALPAARDLPRRRDPAAAGPRARRRGLHQRVLQRQHPRDPQALRRFRARRRRARRAAGRAHHGAQGAAAAAADPGDEASGRRPPGRPRLAPGAPAVPAAAGRRGRRRSRASSRRSTGGSLREPEAPVARCTSPAISRFPTAPRAASTT